MLVPPLSLSLSKMAEEISKPLSETQKVTMVSSGGSEVGAAKLTGEVLDIMIRLPQTVEKLTGVSISQVNMHTLALLAHSALNASMYTVMADQIRAHHRLSFTVLKPLGLSLIVCDLKQVKE